MKAIKFTEYGSPDVLKLTDIEKPVPQDNEILVKIHAGTVTFGDLMVRKITEITLSQFTMPTPFYLPTRMVFGWSKPKINILGAELSGVVESVGQNVSRFNVGDKVIAYPGMNMGANAEYICIAEDSTVAHMPSNISFEEATTIPYGAVMAMPILKKANIQPGQKVLINGASGSIGAMALQLAKNAGAEVTGVCGTPRMEFVKALGADHVIDYKNEDFTQNGETYDVIVDILGKLSFGKVKNSLTENGILLYVSFKTHHVLQGIMTSFGDGKKVICALADTESDYLAQVCEMVESGKVKTFVDRCFPLEQTADAHRYIESGAKQGNVVIKIV